MKVILTMDVPSVGVRGDRVNVAAGYARNYLMPRQLAVAETEGALRTLAEEAKLGEARTAKAQKEAGKIAAWLADHEIFTTLKIGREGKAFGAVTSKDLAILLRKEGLEVDRRRLGLDAPIRRLGVYMIPLNVHPDVETNIKVFVDKEGGCKDGARDHQNDYEEAQKAIVEALKVEEEERAERAREAEEAARIAIEKAAARKIREEEEAQAKKDAEEASRLAAGGTAKSKDGDDAETTDAMDSETQEAAAEDAS
jgi:large subunit ribosomal protein L9